MAAQNKFSLFGFEISRKQNEVEQSVQPSFSPPSNEDGALTISSAAFFV